MSTTDSLTFVGLFVVVLATQLGRQEVRVRRLVLPLVLVGAIGAKYLRVLPSAFTGRLLESGGLLVGALLGLAAVATVRVERDAATGRATTVAGWKYAAIWSAALAARMGFAYGATHFFAAPLAGFSAEHHVAASTYAAAFVLMVLAMITVRSVAVALRSHRIGAPIDWHTLAEGRVGQRIIARLGALAGPRRTEHPRSAGQAGPPVGSARQNRRLDRVPRRATNTIATMTTDETTIR